MGVIFLSNGFIVSMLQQSDNRGQFQIGLRQSSLSTELLPGGCIECLNFTNKYDAKYKHL